LKRSTFFISASSQNPASVGFIGLGNMGRGMAKNLIDKGNQVIGLTKKYYSNYLIKVSQGQTAESRAPNVFFTIVPNYEIYYILLT
jgi:3-hydroxyisobutyrate dehydrogenase-like beta-hydroxyacid dehydrogenase